MYEKLFSYMYLLNNGVVPKIIQLAERPKTSLDIVRLFNCELSHVIKTLMLIADNNPILVSLCGDDKISMDNIKEFTGAKIVRMAKPAEVTQFTDLKIGGITPILSLDRLEKIPYRFVDDRIFSLMSNISIGSGVAEIGLSLRPEEFQRICESLAFKMAPIREGGAISIIAPSPSPSASSSFMGY